MLGGFERAGKMPPSVVVSDPDHAALKRLKERYPGIEIAPGGNARAAGQDVVFLAVPPPAIADALASVKTALRPDAVLVSLAPKLTLARLSEMLGGFQRIARMIPNAPSIIGCGFNPVCFSGALSRVERDGLKDLLAALGDCPEAPESKLEGYALVTGMGPTYLWFQLYELLALAQTFNLTAQEAAEGIDKMVGGAIRTMRDSGLTAEQVMDLIPVKPLGDFEGTVVEAYRAKLRGLWEKIRP